MDETNTMPDQYSAVTLLLIRHGQARAFDSEQLDRTTPLSELGRRQANALAVRLSQGKPLAAIYASPLPRALETAEVVAAKVGLEVVSDERLRRGTCTEDSEVW